jgi:hypothetical protein
MPSRASRYDGGALSCVRYCFRLPVAEQVASIGDQQNARHNKR